MVISRTRPSLGLLVVGLALTLMLTFRSLAGAFLTNRGALSLSKGLMSHASEDTSFLERTVPYLDDAIRIDDRMSNLHYLRGLAQLAAGSPGEAVATLQNALSAGEAKRDNRLVYVFMAQAYELLGHSATADRYWISSGADRLLAALALREPEQHETNRRIHYLRLAIEIAPGEANYYRYLACTHESLSDLQAAARVYEEGVQHAPSDADLQIRLALTYRRLGLYDEAEKLLWSALPKGNASLEAWAYAELGLVYRDRGNFGRAIKMFQEAILIAPGNMNYPLLLGYAYRDAGRFQEALGEFALVAQSKSPSDKAAAYNGIGWVYRAQERWDNAIRFLEMAEELNPSDGNKFDLAVTFQMAGNAYERQLHIERAKVAYENGLSTLQRMGTIGSHSVVLRERMQASLMRVNAMLEEQDRSP